MTTTDLQAAIDHVLRMRGVETPCETCHGLGVRIYGSGATWQGGMGTSKCEKDVCDRCWGTGDHRRHGVDLRKQRDEEDARVAQRAVSLLGEKVGVHLADMKPAIQALAKELEALSRQKNKARPPWFSLVCEQVAKTLREGLEAKP